MCKLGCLSGTGQVVTDYCYINATKDVEEFTDIFLRVDTASGNPSDFSNTSLNLMDLDTGESLINIDGMSPSDSVVKSIKISDSIRLGVKVNNPNNKSLRYKVVAEFGTVILNKKIN
jgi:hypothetical protein